jgi:hypothetical protein
MSEQEHWVARTHLARGCTYRAPPLGHVSYGISRHARSRREVPHHPRRAAAMVSIAWALGSARAQAALPVAHSRRARPSQPRTKLFFRRTGNARERAVGLLESARKAISRDLINENGWPALNHADGTLEHATAVAELCLQLLSKRWVQILDKLLGKHCQKPNTFHTRRAMLSDKKERSWFNRGCQPHQIRSH